MQSQNAKRTSNSGGVPTASNHEQETVLVIPELNWRLYFVDNALQEEFTEFYKMKKLTTVLFFVNLYYTFFLLPSTIGVFAFVQTWGQWLYASVSFLLVIPSIILGWMFYFEHRMPSKYDKWLPTWQASLIILYNSFIVWNCLRVVLAPCDIFPSNIRDFVVGWHCGYQLSLIPDYSLPLLSMYPIAATISFCETRIDLVLAVFILSSAAFLVIAAVFAPESTYLETTGVFTILTSVICIDAHKGHINNFIAYKNLQETLNENKRIHEENRATELKSMIGNLTHDLKTPLSSFMAGMDVIANSINKMIHVMKRPEFQGVMSHLKPQFHELFTCFKNVSNTNTFMVMTINRCIDYTKASKGIKLTPKYDTVELMDALGMPLQCMKNIQNRIKIELLPLSPEICSHIITDKQWLQENLLCLLSNAVKYSGEGTVSISVSLTHHAPTIPPQDTPKPPPSSPSKVVYTTPMKDSTSTTDRVTKNESNSISVHMFANTYYHTALNYLHSPDDSYRASSLSCSSGGGGGPSSPNMSGYFVPTSSPPTIRRKKEIKVIPIDHETAHRLEAASISNDEIAGRESRRPSNSSGPFTTGPITGLFQLESYPIPPQPIPARPSITRVESAKNIVKPYLRVEVSDTGIGINEDAMKQLFSPFQRAQRMAGGTGLGLYSLAKRVDAIRGTYGVHARKDGKQGTTFWFEIPYRSDDISANSEVPTIATTDAILKLLQTLQYLNVHLHTHTRSSSGTGTGGIVPMNGSIDARDDMMEVDNDNEDDASELTDDCALLDEVMEEEEGKNDLLVTEGCCMSTVAATPTSGEKQVDVIHSLVSSITEEIVSPLLPASHNKLTIPVANTTLHPVPIPIPSNTTHNLPHYNILVADDSPTIAKMIQMLLRQNKHKVTLAENGEFARQKILQHWTEHGKGYDIVLMDLQMPVMDGLEATERCREVEQGILHQNDSGRSALSAAAAAGPTAHAAYGKHQIIIGMSANCDEETIEAVNEAGFDDFISKPFSIETFNMMTQKWIA